MMNIKEFLRANGLKQKELADYLGIGEPAVSKMAKGYTNPSEGNLYKILNNNQGWDTSMLEEEHIEIRHDASTKKKESKGLPVLSFAAMAGHLSENNGTEFSDEFEHCVIPDFTSRGADFLIRVDGDSMYPRYANGELLAVRIIDTPTFFQWGRVYVMSTQQGCVVKRIFPDPNNENNILCHSENCANYPDYTIPKGDVLKFAIVVGHAGID